MNFGFCDWKSTFSFSIEKGGEVFRHCVFWDTIQSIEGVDQTHSKKKGRISFRKGIKESGMQNASTIKKSLVIQPQRGIFSSILYPFGDMAEW